MCPAISPKERAVPNAPCGVESSFCIYICFPRISVVPNAPCGVERAEERVGSMEKGQFLMHRVELKVAREISSVRFKEKFLMHRVELKGLNVIIDCAFTEGS